MRRAQTIWRLTLVGCWLALASACHTGPKRPLPEGTRQRGPHLELPSAAAPAVSAEGGKASPAASAITEALRSVHRVRLPITAPSIQPERLALGAGRLLQAATNNVVLRDAKTGEVIAEAPLAAVSSLGQGSDGSLFALALSGGVRFLPRQNAPKSFPHVPFFPGSELFPDLQDSSYFFVHLPNDAQLYRYCFEAEGGAVLPIDTAFEIPGCTGNLSLLRDGAFVCSTGTSIVRKAPRGLKTEFQLPAGSADPIRLLPAKRLDELYAVSRSGEVTHLRLAAGTPLLAHFQLPAPPFAALGNGEVLAFLLVTPPGPGEPRRWTLLVTDLDGRPRFQTGLSERDAPADDNWVEAVISDKNLAISTAEPLVAVGGPERVQLWDYAQGRQLFAR